jgi:hypothetical protein
VSDVLDVSAAPAVPGAAVYGDGQIEERSGADPILED